MMQKVAFITENDAVFGFRLAGFDQFLPGDGEPAELVARLVADPEYGLLVIDERLVDDRLDAILQELETAWAGVVVVLPPPIMAESLREDYAVKLMRRAIGCHVRVDIS